MAGVVGFDSNNSTTPTTASAATAAAPVVTIPGWYRGSLRAFQHDVNHDEQEQRQQRHQVLLARDSSPAQSRFSSDYDDDDDDDDGGGTFRSSTSNGQQQQQQQQRLREKWGVGGLGEATNGMFGGRRPAGVGVAAAEGVVQVGGGRQEYSCSSNTLDGKNEIGRGLGGCVTRGGVMCSGPSLHTASNKITTLPRFFLSGPPPRQKKLTSHHATTLTFAHGDRIATEPPRLQASHLWGFPHLVVIIVGLLCIE